MRTTLSKSEVNALINTLISNNLVNLPSQGKPAQGIGGWPIDMVITNAVGKQYKTERIGNEWEDAWARVFQKLAIISSSVSRIKPEVTFVPNGQQIDYSVPVIKDKIKIFLDLFKDKASFNKLPLSKADGDLLMKAAQDTGNSNIEGNMHGAQFWVAGQQKGAQISIDAMINYANFLLEKCRSAS
jgi:hypothetical protein